MHSDQWNPSHYPGVVVQIFTGWMEILLLAAQQTDNVAIRTRILLQPLIDWSRITAATAREWQTSLCFHRLSVALGSRSLPRSFIHSSIHSLITRELMAAAPVSTFRLCVLLRLFLCVQICAIGNINATHETWNCLYQFRRLIFLSDISLLQRTDLFLNEAISLETAVCLSQSSPASSVALYHDAAAFFPAAALAHRFCSNETMLQ